MGKIQLAHLPHRCGDPCRDDVIIREGLHNSSDCLAVVSAMASLHSVKQKKQLLS